MKKLLTMTMIMTMLILSCTGCFGDKNSDKKGTDLAGPEVWESISGSFAREDSSQYNNGELQIKYLSNNCAMFEFRLMEGSESEDSAESIVLPFVLLVGEDGMGRYESLPAAQKPFAIDFALSKNGKQVTVTHTGEISISPDGVYKYTNSSLEVSEVSAIAILDHLPTAATSLNSNNGAYTIKYPEELIADWFYPVQAVFNDTQAVLAKFMIAKDLSAVYRTDDDIEPVLIFGTAQPMLDAEYIQFRDPMSSEDEEINSQSDEPMQVVAVSVEKGVSLAVGEKSRLTAVMPWELPYTLSAKSSDAAVLKVDKNGMIQAVSTGQATLSGTITVDDGTKRFSIKVSVDENTEAVPTDI